MTTTAPVLILALAAAQFAEHPRPRGQEPGTPYEAAPPVVREAAAHLFRSKDFTELLCMPPYWRRHLSEAQIKKLVANLTAELENPESLKLKDLKGLVIAGHVEPENVEGCSILPQDVLRVNGRAAFVLEELFDFSLPQFLDAGATDRAKVRENARKARRAVLARFRWPAPTRPGVVAPWEAQKLVDDAIEKLLIDVQYGDLIDLVDRWSKEMPELALNALVSSLLDRLVDAEKVTFGTLGSRFVLSRVLAGDAQSTINTEMVEQDIDFVNGRCAWAIERLLGCVLPSFTAATNRDPKALAARAAQSYGIVIESMTLTPPKKVEHRMKPFDGAPPKP